jgi:hypothetical protein
VDFFLENYSQPPLRAEKTHEANLRAGQHLKGSSPKSAIEGEGFWTEQVSAIAAGLNPQII